LHICYCCSPIRYAWDLQQQYLEEAGLTRGLKGCMAKLLLHYIRIWDTRTAFGVNHFLTLSRYVGRRIRKTYGRDSTVIYPPVDVEKFELGGRKEDFYFAASRMVPYKRMDLIVEAFAKMPKRRLVVVGDGPEMQKVRSKVGPNVELLGYQNDVVMRDLMQRARAFVFAAEEDFGIIPVEAQACGTPVIGYGRGGLTETIVEGETGILFTEQTPEALRYAVDDFENRQGEFDANRIRRNAERFSVSRFRTEFAEFVEEKLEEFAVDQRKAVAKSLNREGSIAV
jgi:glycosyltransferase involved in cell wall biosynthesis